MALEDIPNYRQGTREEQCGNCGALQYRGSTNAEHNRRFGWCKMYAAEVEKIMVCDSWYAKLQRRFRAHR